MTKALLKRLHSPDISDLASYRPTDATSFAFLLQVFAGPDGEEGEESFDVMVCTPAWLHEKAAQQHALLGRHHLIVDRYDYSHLERFIAEYCRNCRGQSWREVAGQLGRLGKWEFEDYSSSDGFTLPV